MCQDLSRPSLVPQALLGLLLQQAVHEIKDLATLANDEVSPEEHPIVQNVPMHLMHVLVEEGCRREEHLVDDDA